MKNVNSKINDGIIVNIGDRFKMNKDFIYDSELIFKKGDIITAVEDDYFTEAYFQGPDGQQSAVFINDVERV